LAYDVRHIIRAALAADRGHPALAAAVDHEEARLPVDRLAQETLAAAGQALGPMLAAHQRELGALDPARAARTLPALVRAVIDAWTSDAGADNRVAEDEAVRAVLGYLRGG
jgi:hypothetical protein